MWCLNNKKYLTVQMSSVWTACHAISLQSLAYSWCTLHPPREAPPVGKHHERQTFTVEVTNCLSRLKSWIWKPHLARLLQNLTWTHRIWSLNALLIRLMALYDFIIGQNAKRDSLTLDSESKLAGSAGTVNSTVRVSTAMTPRGIPPNLCSFNLWLRSSCNLAYI